MKHRYQSVNRLGGFASSSVKYHSPITMQPSKRPNKQTNKQSKLRKNETSKVGGETFVFECVQIGWNKFQIGMFTMDSSNINASSISLWNQSRLFFKMMSIKYRIVFIIRIFRKSESNQLNHSTDRHLILCCILAPSILLRNPQLIRPITLFA